MSSAGARVQPACRRFTTLIYAGHRTHASHRKMRERRELPRSSDARSARRPERIVHLEDSPTRGHALVTRATHASSLVSLPIVGWDRLPAIIGCLSRRPRRSRIAQRAEGRVLDGRPSREMFVLRPAGRAYLCCHLLHRHGYRPGGGPEEASEFAGDRHHRDVAQFPAMREPSEATVQPLLRFPTDRQGRWRQAQLSLLQGAPHLRRAGILPCRLHQYVPNVRIAGLGNLAAVAAVSARILGGDQPCISHEMARRREASKIAEFGDQDNGSGERDAAECL